ncbi:MAG: signal peptidase II [Bryobacterales bacterium]|nr:signal peptidase II [Bryobacterales bacterium]
MRNQSTLGTGARVCCGWMGSGNRSLWVLAGLVVIGDRVSKAAIVASMPHGASETVIGGFFNLVHVRNTGIAFSLFADSAPWFRDLLLPGISMVAIGVIVALLWRQAKLSRTSRIALVLILAGAVGNLYDRLLYGYVTDFLDLYVGSYHWPAFNVADSAITIGAVMLLAESIFVRNPHSEEAGTA